MGTCSMSRIVKWYAYITLDSMQILCSRFRGGVDSDNQENLLWFNFLPFLKLQRNVGLLCALTIRWDRIIFVNEGNKFWKFVNKE